MTEKKIMRKTTLGILLLSLGVVTLLPSSQILFPFASGFNDKSAQNYSGPSDPPNTVLPKEGSKAENSKFPIYPYFQIKRNFGYHIGDEIPLTLIIEAKKEVVLDLVNLPHKGEIHGPFEVRNLQIHTEEASDTKIYRIDFNLQTFKPILAVDTVEFPPLDILYATPDGVNSLSGEYQYQNVISMPYPISFSRTATYFSSMKDIKGLMVEEHFPLVWGSILLGALLWAGTMGNWMWRWYTARAGKVQSQKKLSLEERTLQTITEAWEQYIVQGGRAEDLLSKTSLAFRKYIGEVYGIPTTTKTFLQLKEALQGKPHQSEILEVLGKCHAVLYEGYTPGRREQEETIKQLKELTKQISTVSKARDLRVSLPTQDKAREQKDVENRKEKRVVAISTLIRSRKKPKSPLPSVSR
jgi:hypothetical protein